MRYYDRNPATVMGRVGSSSRLLGNVEMFMNGERLLQARIAKVVHEASQMWRREQDCSSKPVCFGFHPYSSVLLIIRPLIEIASGAEKPLRGCGSMGGNQKMAELMPNRKASSMTIHALTNKDYPRTPNVVSD